MMIGRIIKQISNDYTVLTDNNTYICKARGKFRNQNITPLVGDKVVFDENELMIKEIQDRTTQLIRPSISNIDQAVIITSVKHPDFSSNLLDKLLVVIEFADVKPIICFTKLDLLKEEEISNIKKIMDYYKKIGYLVFDNNDSNLKEIFKNKITVFTGQSGSGKSTLLNKLDSSLNIKTDEISLALGRGKHTTRHVELLQILGGLVADTPGFSALDLKTITNEQIKDTFVEFTKHRNECEYSDCMHINENKCKVKQLVDNGDILKSRYDNYLKFLKR